MVLHPRMIDRRQSLQYLYEVDYPKTAPHKNRRCPNTPGGSFCRHRLLGTVISERRPRCMARPERICRR